MAWYKELETGKYWFSKSGFTTATRDWNYDGDVYTDTVMMLWELDGNAYNTIHEYNMNDYESVPENEVKDYLREVLNEYFIDCGDYWTDPTYTNPYTHYGDKSFIKGGYCRYNNDRQLAIDKEIDYQFNQRFKER